jgi:hypothetical protein
VGIRKGEGVTGDHGILIQGVSSDASQLNPDVTEHLRGAAGQSMMGFDLWSQTEVGSQPSSIED